MKAVYLAAGRVAVRETDIPERKAGQALLRMLVAGVCNTDLELQRGYYGFSGIPGHEFVAEVIQCDNANLTGKRVVGEINLNCNACEFCSAGLGRHCPFRKVLGIVDYPGAFAEYLVLPERNLHEVPQEVLTEQAVFTEPLAAACEVLDQVSMERGERVAVLGDGKLGLLIAQVLNARGLQVVLFGRHETKLTIARRAGIETNGSNERPKAAFRVVVEATGSAAGLAEAVTMTRPRGTVVMKSTIHQTVALDTAPVIVNEISLVGSRCGRFEPAIDLLSARRVQVAEMVETEFPLGAAEEGFARAAQRGTLKVLLRNDQ
ncbi:MAG: alcohol dehydrogenase catalytic domain-containing protein [Acidobacteriaceae bacterium]|nr:alcohol dehydrogenase catalytic domain-containing protein [Acidobacteriaceae bacterium]